MAQPTPDPARRSQLLALKLSALVRDHAGDGPVQPGIWPGGAALVRGDVAWVLAEEKPERSLGPALAWARQQNATASNLVAEAATGVLARRAALFASPRPTVFHAEGRALLDAIPEPHPVESAVPVEHERFVDLIRAAGAVPTHEYGVLVGEVGGLEVCRAITDPLLESVRLEVGVGAHDREAFLLMHGDVPPEEALAKVVAAVSEHRRLDASPHPLNRLGSERLLRAWLLDHPEAVGASFLEAAAPPVPRANLKDPVPCVAVGTDRSGAAVVVVCSVGIDLDVVPFAADARDRHAPDARLVIAVPARDDVPVTRALAAHLVRPAEVVGLTPLA